MVLLTTPPPSPRVSRKAIRVERVEQPVSERSVPPKPPLRRRSSTCIANDPRRWQVLAVYASANFMAALVWNILAPVYAVAEERFGARGRQCFCSQQVLTFARSGYGSGHINALAYAYYVWYCPGSILALWMMERFGLRVSLLSGFASQLSMVLLSVVACRIADPHAAYWTLWAGTLVGALGQPLFINNVTRLAADWFPVTERDMAVTLSTVARALGVMLISASAPYLVQSPSQVGRLYDWQLPVWLLIGAAGLYICTDRPLMPPSASAATLWATEDESAKKPLPSGVSHARRAMDEVWSQTLTLCGMPNFMWLALSYSLITGVSWAFLTAVGQILEPCGYSTYNAGMANAVLMGATVAGCFAAAPMVESTRAYVALQRGFSWASLAGAVAVMATARPSGFAAMLAAWALVGFCVGPLSPITYEHAVEMSFPIPAQTSAAVLIVSSNLLGFMETLGVTLLLKRPASASCSSTLTPAALFVVLMVTLGIVCAHMVQKDYRRQAADEELDADDGEGGAGEVKGDAGEKTPLLRS
jgi:MFS family permease